MNRIYTNEETNERKIGWRVGGRRKGSIYFRDLEIPKGGDYKNVTEI
jgi:hypothetical protein